VLSLERSSGCSHLKILDPFPTRISSLRDSVLCADKLFAHPCHDLGFRKACCSICRPDSFFSTVLDYCLCFVFLCAVCHQNHFPGLVLSPARRQESCSLLIDLAPLDCIAVCQCFDSRLRPGFGSSRARARLADCAGLSLLMVTLISSVL
jgi:hypothetical protein